MKTAFLLGLSVLASGAATAVAAEGDERCSIGASYFETGALIRSGSTVVECTSGNLWVPTARTTEQCTYNGSEFPAGATIATQDAGSVIWSCAAGGAWQTG